jgi:hypothetical protein
MREPHSCSDDRKIGSGCRNTIIRVTNKDQTRAIPLKGSLASFFIAFFVAFTKLLETICGVIGMCIHPHDPNYVSFPCGDPFVRTYDLRRVGTATTAVAATQHSTEVLFHFLILNPLFIHCMTINPCLL